MDTPDNTIKGFAHGDNPLTCGYRTCMAALVHTLAKGSFRSYACPVAQGTAIPYPLCAQRLSRLPSCAGGRVGPCLEKATRVRRSEAVSRLPLATAPLCLAPATRSSDGQERSIMHAMAVSVRLREDAQ